MRVEESVEINRPVEEVFSYASDPEHFPEWSGIILEVQKEGTGVLAEGESLRLSASSWAAGSRHPLRFTLINYDYLCKATDESSRR
jgi:uncharacterized protein YndB with AHSA1/START domain